MVIKLTLAYFICSIFKFYLADFSNIPVLEPILQLY